MLRCTDAVGQMLIQMFMNISSNACNKPQARYYTLMLCVGELRPRKSYSLSKVTQLIRSRVKIQTQNQL